MFRIIDGIRRINGNSYLNAQLWELKYAMTFRDTVTIDSWFNLERESISLGRSAVGYNYYYVCYRILNEMKPNSILEMGLGQSTKLLNSYAQHFNCEHTVIEHDEEWKDYYETVNPVSQNTKIELIPLKYEYKKIGEGGYNFIRYNEGLLKNAINGKKFDLISIDGPFGDQNRKAFKKSYSRVDILDYLPQCLCKDFVILMDDYNRKGEKNTVFEIEKALRNGNILYDKGIYIGETTLCVITSKNWRFLCTL